ncbi:MAG: argininosuccinate lyase [Desulfatibacillaceae bacterium]
MAEKPWDGVFTEATDELVERFTASHQVDRELHEFDIAGSTAHTRTLERAGVLTPEESNLLALGLEQVREEIASGKMRWSDSLEDVHMHVESRLADILGPLARKMHTGRSRNDQIAVDTRLYLKDRCRKVLAGLLALREALVEQAAAHTGTFVPGYTHLQRAQPVLLAHHLLAYAEMFARDYARFSDCLERTDVMPLGSAALAGTTFPIDREYTAELLGFSKVSKNSMDAVSDRDFAMEFCSAASIAMVHLSRLSEEIVLWASTEFGFLKLPDAFATGSSIMPQKRNPDVAELTRGKSGRVFGNLVALLTIMKGLPLAYNRDMQEDKEPLFDSVNTVSACIEVFARMVPRLEFVTERMADACETGYLNATDLADYLAARGVPFREAHNVAGRAVQYGISQGKELHEMTLDELRRFSDRVEEDIFESLATEAVVNRRKSAGGTATENVRAALEAARVELERDKAAFSPEAGE